MRAVRWALFLAVLIPRGAAAQETRAQPVAASGAITVSGRGAAMAVPDRARVSIVLMGANAQGMSLDDAAIALRDDLRANGVPDAEVVQQMGNLDLRRAFPAVVGTLRKPTREAVEAMARAVDKAFPVRFAAVLTNVQIQPTLIVDDCDADEYRAQRAAFADARRRAEHLAAIAGVRLGAVTSIVALPNEPPAGCATKPDPVYANANFGLGPFASTYGPLTIPIVVNETVTFAIAAP